MRAARGICSPLQPVGVAAAVPVLVMAEGDGVGHGQARVVADDLGPEARVAADDLPLLEIGGALLAQDLDRDEDIAHVVQAAPAGGWRARRPRPGQAPADSRALNSPTRSGCRPGSTSWKAAMRSRESTRVRPRHSPPRPTWSASALEEQALGGQRLQDRRLVGADFAPVVGGEDAQFRAQVAEQVLDGGRQQRVRLQAAHEGVQALGGEVGRAGKEGVGARPAGGSGSEPAGIQVEVAPGQLPERGLVVQPVPGRRADANRPGRCGRSVACALADDAAPPGGRAGA